MKISISNIQLKSIEARRYSDLSTPLQKVMVIKDDEARVDFQYTASYGPVGMIKIDGSLVFKGPKMSEVVKNYTTSRKMPNEVASGFHTAVMHACVPEAVGIAKVLRLPPPIPLPQVRLGKTPTTGASGPEVA
jgi:predicted ribonuclease toxin of YeeF-YezG toxin-antitoxin module